MPPEEPMGLVKLPSAAAQRSPMLAGITTAAELWITCSISISILKAAVLSNCVHGAERGPISGLRRP
jgi:hypothetical protein